MQSFKGLNIKESVLSVLSENGYSNPSPVQQSVIPSALRGESVLAQSPTGSGKTHAYLIPILCRIDTKLPRLQAVIVAPTRELARQVYDFAMPFAKADSSLRVRLFSGNNNREADEEGLGPNSQPHIAIGTPGRLLDLFSSGLLNPKEVKTAVLDEADMLLDMGFFEEASAILALFSNPQVLVFSATLKEHLKSALAKYVKADLRYEGGEIKTASEVSHHLVDVRHRERAAAAAELLRIKRPYFAIVFVNKKEEAAQVALRIRESGFGVVSYTGDLSERERRKTMRMIRENRYQVVVASDLLSRGIDLPDVDLVVSTDVPSDLDFYYHRAGRTGRFGKNGDSYVLYDMGEEQRAKALYEAGVPFDMLTIKGGQLVHDPKGLGIHKGQKRQAYEDDEKREIAIAKARHSGKSVKPGYRKKAKLAVEKVKRKYRRKAISKAIRKNLSRKK